MPPYPTSSRVTTPRSAPAAASGSNPPPGTYPHPVSGRPMWWTGSYWTELTHGPLPEQARPQIQSRARPPSHPQARPQIQSQFQPQLQSQFQSQSTAPPRHPNAAARRRAPISAIVGVLALLSLVPLAAKTAASSSTPPAQEVAALAAPAPESAPAEGPAPTSDDPGSPSGASNPDGSPATAGPDAATAPVAAPGTATSPAASADDPDLPPLVTPRPPPPPGSPREFTIDDLTAELDDIDALGDSI